MSSPISRVMGIVFRWMVRDRIYSKRPPNSQLQAAELTSSLPDGLLFFSEAVFRCSEQDLEFFIADAHSH